ncbi:MAG: hypothetical protein CMP22_05740 [Rickettsiales bacterium]|nr:hypothetical protein [Rickettsiales bacterium]
MNNPIGYEPAGVRLLNTFAVFGVQIALWFFFSWWVALLSLLGAIVFSFLIGFLLIPLASKFVDTVIWPYYVSLSKPILFGLGQVLSAILLNYFI